MKINQNATVLKLLESFKYVERHNCYRCFFIKIKDIRQQSDSVLRGMRDQLALELSIERRKIAATGVQSKVFKNREIRRTIARINTVLKERGAKA